MEEPGTLPESLTIVSRICAISMKNLRRFLAKWPQTFIQMEGKLVCNKLRKNWINYKEQSEMRAEYGKLGGLAKARNLLEQTPTPAPASSPALAPNTKRLKPSVVFSEPSEEFKAFWELYPRKIAKQDAIVS